MSSMQGLFGLAVALAALAAPAAAQQSRGGAAAGGSVQCQGCDSAQLAAARAQAVAADISKLTLELARNRILLENLQSRLDPASPEPPRNDRERAELRASAIWHQNEMTRLVREISTRCGQQMPVRGYLGVETEQTINTETGPAGRASSTMSYHTVHSVRAGTPAARAGLEPGDTIIAMNRTDARVRSLEPFLRTPGAKLMITVGRASGRKELAVTVGERPATFDGACLQYRDYRFVDEQGRNVVMYRQPGSGGQGAGGTVVRSGAGAAGAGGATRARVNVTADGQQPVHVVLSPDSTVQSTFILIPPAAAGGALFLSRGGSGAIVAGAEISLVNGGLRTIFGVDHGALVLNVAPRSPAEQAGILSGDVIVSAGGEKVTAISVLQRQIHDAHDKRSVTLDVVRAKQAKQITLRW